MEYLLENKANLFLKSPEQFTALDYAIVYGHYNGAMFLIEKN